MKIHNRKRHFEYLIDLENHRHEKRLNEIKYWEGVSRKFQRKKKEKIKVFKLEFKHELGAYYDNEFVIDLYARESGFYIYNEKLYPDKSVYYFRTIEKKEEVDG